MAEFYQSMAPLPHDWDTLAEEPWPESFNFDHERRYFGATKDDPAMIVREVKTKTDDLGFIPEPTEAYGPWIAQVAKDWKATAEQFKKIPGITDEQKAEIDSTYEAHYRALAYFAEMNRGAFEEWHHELDRLEDLKEERKNDDAPYMAERISDKKSETTGKWRPLLGGVGIEEDLYKSDLKSLLTDEQLDKTSVKQRSEAILNPPAEVKSIDRVVTWFTLGVGVLLITGLFTRLTSVAAAGFLLSVMSTQPVWVEGVPSLAVALFPYQGIEFFALLVLAGLGAGRWAGLDGVLFGRKEDKEG
ncbi:DoxX family protein [Aeoliella mucimassa]|nr:DoxX family protein [Aeoliella mucimassa]